MTLSNQTILAIDTVTGGTQVALALGQEKRLISKSDDRPHAQAECLMPLIEQIMSEGKKAFKEMDAIICTSGPGSFTGLRTGLAAAKALAMATDLPLYGISTFDAFALQYQSHTQKKQPLCVLIESRRAEFFSQLYNETGQKHADPSLVLSKDLQEYLSKGFKGQMPVLIGNGVPRLLEEIKTEIEYVQEHVQLEIGIVAQNFNPNDAAFIKDPAPVYLRGADISQPKHKPRQMA